MRYTILLLSFLLVSGLASAEKHKAKNARAKDIDSLIAFAPLTSVTILSNGSTTHSDSFSTIARNLQIKVLNTFAEKIRLKTIWDTSDTALARKVRNEIAYLFYNAADDKYLEDIKVPPIIDSITNSKGMRYALLMLSGGFMRTEANYEKALKSSYTAHYARSGKRYQYMPVKSGVIGRAMIIDSKEHKTYWYKLDTTVPEEEWSPIEYITYKQQFQYLFNHFFWVLN